MRIAFDLDMTCNNMAYMWADWIRRTIDPTFRLGQVRYFGYILDAYGSKADDYWREPQAYDEIIPLPGVVELLSTLKAEGHESFILTHTPPGQNSRRKDLWIAEHLGDLEVVHSGEKWFHTADCLFIDDHPGHVQRHVLAHPHCHGVVFNHMDNYGWAEPLLKQSNVHRCRNYTQLLEVIRGNS